MSTWNERVRPHTGRTRLAAAMHCKAYWNESGEDVYELSYRARVWDSNAGQARQLGRTPRIFLCVTLCPLC